MNAIASLGIKVKDLYKISFEDFIRQHPEYKKLSKEVQQKRYELYDEERLSNINRCILKRQEIIKNTKKVKPIQKKFKIDGEESDEEDNANYDLFLNQNYKERKSEDNYILRKNYSGKNKKFLPTNKIIVTENSYIMNNSNGKQSQMTKEDIDSITCIKNEKNKLEKKNEKKDEQLMRYLKVELERAQKIRKVKDKLNEKDKKIQKFMKVKDKGMKRMENDRYKDHQDVYERQKIYEKMLSNYDQKIYLSKQQQLEQYRTLNLNKISSETSKKMEELNKQIEDYERKNQEYKEKITNLFDLKEKEEIDKKIKERLEKKELNDSSQKIETSSNLIKKKLNNLEEKLEIEKYRRENALMQSMNKFQDKINTLLEKKEKKEKKIQNAILKAEKEKEEKMMKRTNHFNEVRQNVKNNERKSATKREKLLEDIEKRDLKLFVIKQEKMKINEERRKMNKLHQDERNALKLKIQEIINDDKKLQEGEKNEEIIQKLMNENNKQ